MSQAWFENSVSVPMFFSINIGNIGYQYQAISAMSVALAPTSVALASTSTDIIGLIRPVPPNPILPVYNIYQNGPIFETMDSRFTNLANRFELFKANKKVKIQLSEVILARLTK